MTVRVRYDRTIFYNPSNRFCILCFRTADKGIPEKARERGRFRDGMIRFTGTGYDIPRTDAVELELSGEWTEGKYGLQLKVQEWKEIVPVTPEGIKAYLSSGLLKGIGEKTAEAIVDRFGTDTQDILENHPEKLLEIRGITCEKVEEIKRTYAESRALRDIMILLAPFRLTPVTASAIYGHFGPGCLDILKKSPFELCRMSGFGFRRVDAIVRKAGGDTHDPGRIRGAVFCALAEASEKGGDLYLTEEILLKRVYGLLNDRTVMPAQRVTGEECMRVKDAMTQERVLIPDGDRIYMPKVYDMEDAAARNIAALLLNTGAQENIGSELESVKTESGTVLSVNQEKAVRMVFSNSISMITGSPGTGKTTVLRTILDVFDRKHGEKKTLLMAPTGRAGRRMAESTGRKHAKTVHSALGLTGSADSPFRRQEEYLDADLIVVDEFSMVDMFLAWKLFARIRPGTRVLLVGDADQLPSVGAGNVFREMMECGMIPVTVLSEIFRQSKESFIPYNARLINGGNTKLYFGEEFRFVRGESQSETADIICRLYYEEAEREGPENVRILTPFRCEGDTSAEHLNAVIRETVNPFRTEEEEIRVGNRSFRKGDRIMQTRNTGEASNGDLGVIAEIKQSGEGKKILINFGEGRQTEYTPEQMKDIEFAYAATIHKAMGSEYSTVLIPLLMAHSIMLSRNLIYTAVTRAKKRVILVGQKAALCMAVKRNDTGLRNTALGDRIRRHHAAFLKREKVSEGSFVERLKNAG